MSILLILSIIFYFMMWQYYYTVRHSFSGPQKSIREQKYRSKLAKPKKYFEIKREMKFTFLFLRSTYFTVIFCIDSWNATYNCSSDRNKQAIFFSINGSYSCSFENVKKWLNDWFGSINQQFFWRGIHKLPERWGKCIDSDGHYFEE